jgi:hypothetical protein
MQPPCTPHRLQLVKPSSSLFTPPAGVQQVTFTELVISFIDSLLGQGTGLPCRLENKEQHYG